MILLIETVSRRYLGRQRDVDAIGFPPAAERDERGRPISSWQLGPLLDPSDPPFTGRLHALTINLRRRVVTLLAPRVDILTEAPEIRPLAPFLISRLQYPWVIGAALLEQQPVLLLDLRRMATDLALGLRLSPV